MSGLSAIKSIVDPTQDASSNELLELCSGRFDQSQHPAGHMTERRRHPSDGSTQGVRELLGLPLQSKPPSILKLLDEEGRDSLMKEDSQNSAEMNEVIGLCSGVFPTTQVTQSSKRSLVVPSKHTVLPGTISDDSQSGEEGRSVFKHTAGDKAVLRWAKRQMKLHGHQRSKVTLDSDDEDMPVIKRRRVRLRQKPNNG